MGRQLTLAASDTQVRILDNSVEIARHIRSYDRHELVLDPAQSGGGAQKQAQSPPLYTWRRVLNKPVPESKTLLDLALTQGESAGIQTSQLMKLLDE